MLTSLKRRRDLKRDAQADFSFSFFSFYLAHEKFLVKSTQMF